jgi:hypothetical protein
VSEFNKFTEKVILSHSFAYNGFELLEETVIELNSGTVLSKTFKLKVCSYHHSSSTPLIHIL